MAKKRKYRRKKIEVKENHLIIIIKFILVKNTVAAV